jgi:hypothetical protein
LDQLRARAAAFRLADGESTTAAAMARELTDLHTLLAEHIVEEEREVFPVITAHVSATDWQMVEDTAKKRGRMSFDGPRTMAVMTDDERAQMNETIGPVLRALIAVMSKRHRRFDHHVFG